MLTKKSIIIIIIGLFYLFTPNAKAQESLGFGVTPPSFELNANPGNVLNNVVKLDNPTNEPINIVVDARNFEAQGESGAVELKPLDKNDSSYSLASWIEVEPKTAVLKPKERKTFKFKIRVPLNAEPGGHFGSIVFRINPSEDQESEGAKVAQEIGSLVLLKIAGDVKENAEILTFKPVNSFYEYGPVDFQIRTQNNGNVHVKPKGYIVISDFFGKTVDKIEITPKNVLPKAIRLTEAKWNKRFLFSKYTAVATLSYGADNNTITATTAFYGFPYKIIGISLLAVSLISFLFIKSRKRLAKAYKVLFGND